MDSIQWTRRRLLQAAAAGATAVAMDPYARALAVSGERDAATPDGRSILYVASHPKSFQVFAARSGQWQPVQRILSMAPSAFALLPGGSRLFVANAIDRSEGLPAGRIETYRVDARSGKPDLIHVRTLPLGLKQPTQIALSPGGRMLAAANAAGIISLHTVGSDGTAGEAFAVRKDLQMAATGLAPRLRFLDEEHLCATCEGHAPAQFQLSFSGFTPVRCTQTPARQKEASLHPSILKQLDHPEPRAVLQHWLS